MRQKLGVSIALLAIFIAACGRGTPEVVSLSVGDVPASVKGNVVSIPVSVSGFEVRKADGDTSGKTGHYHVFVDRAPVDVGTAIVMGPGIVHSAESPIKVYGLGIGEHDLHVVLGDGTHKRVLGKVEEEVTVDVKGPAVRAIAHPAIDVGDDLLVRFLKEDVKIVKPDGDMSGKTGHYHVLIDPAEPPVPGEVIAPPEPGKIIHTADPKVTLKGLEKGQHEVWVVIGDGEHRAFDPPVMAKLIVVVR